MHLRLRRTYGGSDGYTDLATHRHADPVTNRYANRYPYGPDSCAHWHADNSTNRNPDLDPDLDADLHPHGHPNLWMDHSCKQVFW